MGRSGLKSPARTSSVSLFTLIIVGVVGVGVGVGVEVLAGGVVAVVVLLTSGTSTRVSSESSLSESFSTPATSIDVDGVESLSAPCSPLIYIESLATEVALSWCCF